jgi:heat shock protein HtpX
LSRRVLSPDVRAGLGVRMAAVLAVLLAVSAAVGWLLLAGVRAVVGGVADDPATGVAVVGAFAVGFALVQYVLGRRLAVASVDAVDLPADRYPGVHRTVAEVADGYGIATPRVMVARMGAPNAFAVGRRGDSTVVLSVELLFLLDRTELEAVIAHELAHVHHRDSVLLTATATVRSLVEGVVTTVALAVGGAVALLVEGGTRLLHPQNRGTGVDWTRTVALWVWGVTVLALLGLLLFSAALSRHREFAADASAAALLGDGDALADALEKIARSQAESPLATLGTHSAESDPLAALATHPPVEERIGRLRTPRR